MKFKLIVLIVFASFIFGCSLNNDTTEPIKTKTLYHLLNVQEGVAGVDDDYNLNEIIWFFDAENGILEVDNNNTDDTKADGLATGDYVFSTIEENNKQYLLIDNTEMGRIYVSNNNLIIDENDLSDGSGADGFVYSFGIQIVAE